MRYSLNTDTINSYNEAVKNNDLEKAKSIVKQVANGKLSDSSVRDSNGNIINGLIVNDEIVVNPLSQKGAVSTTVHEWTHSLENTEVYKTLKDLVIKKVGGQEKFDQLAEQMIKDYSSVTQLSKEGAEAEVVASSVENLLGNEDFIKEINKYDSNIAHRMYEDLKAMFDGQTLDEGIEYAFKKAFEESKESVIKEGYQDVTNETTGYENVPDSLLGFAKDSTKNKSYDEQKYKYNLDVYVSVDGGETFFEDSIKGLNRKQAIERAKRNWNDSIIYAKDEQGKAQYSLGNAIKLLKEGKFYDIFSPNTRVTIRKDTPSILLNNVDGMKNLPMVIDAKHIITALGGKSKGTYTHHLNESKLLEVSASMENPIAIFKHKELGTINMVLDLKDVNNRNVVVSIKPNSGQNTFSDITSDGNYIVEFLNTNRVKSIFGIGDNGVNVENYLNQKVERYYYPKDMTNKKLLQLVDQAILGHAEEDNEIITQEDSESKSDQNTETIIGAKYSIGSMFQAAGMEIKKEDSYVKPYLNGKEVKTVSYEMVENSPVGRLLDASVKMSDKQLEGKAFITQEEANKQKQLYADFLNTIARTRDADLVWAISGSIGYKPAKEGEVINETKNTKSSAFTGNSDAQYGTTFDVTTICNKTQQLINVMSEVMVQKGRGLTEEEIVKIVYDEVYKSGEPVPCPVCYVFARWVGVGGLLDNIKNYQDEYSNIKTSEIQTRFNALEKQVNQLVAKNKLKGTDARNALEKQLTKEYYDLKSKEDSFKLQGKELNADDKSKLNELSEDIKIMDRWSWIKNVRLDSNYKPVPNDILFDMNRGEEFANKYPKAWTFRTTRGPAMGKAITPYSSEVLGQTIIGYGTSGNTLKSLGTKRSASSNVFLGETINSKGMSKLSSAIKKAAAQNLIGGSRMQSTSDFRFEYVTDYLLHFLELQSIGSYGQTYTKVPEAVPLIASVGFETNCSLMASEYGWEEVEKGTRNAIELNGKYYRLTFSSTTGMNPQDAFKLSSTYDNVVDHHIIC